MLDHFATDLQFVLRLKYQLFKLSFPSPSRPAWLPTWNDAFRRVAVHPFSISMPPPATTTTPPPPPPIKLLLFLLLSLQCIILRQSKTLPCLRSSLSSLLPVSLHLFPSPRAIAAAPVAPVLAASVITSSRAAAEVILASTSIQPPCFS